MGRGGTTYKKKAERKSLTCHPLNFFNFVNIKYPHKRFHQKILGRIPYLHSDQASTSKTQLYLDPQPTCFYVVASRNFPANQKEVFQLTCAC